MSETIVPDIVIHHGIITTLDRAKPIANFVASRDLASGSEQGA